jgi:hypothetical protein
MTAKTNLWLVMNFFFELNSCHDIYIKGKAILKNLSYLI